MTGRESRPRRHSSSPVGRGLGSFEPEFTGHAPRPIRDRLLAPPARIPTRVLAPQVGFEPTTLRLTAGCSTLELLFTFLREVVKLESWRPS